MRLPSPSVKGKTSSVSRRNRNVPWRWAVDAVRNASARFAGRDGRVCASTSTMRFLYAQTIDIDTYDRHVEKLREQLTLARIDRHATELEEIDVEGILAFAERVLPSASNLWVQSSFAQKQRLQRVFFPEGIRFDGKKLVGTGTTLPVFNYLSPVSHGKGELVDLNSASWNRVQEWLSRLEAVRRAA